MATGWQQLGTALGGDQSEKAYEEGLALGAKTQNALAEARKRVDANVARESLAESLGDVFGGGMSPTDEALAYANLARSEVNLGDLFGARAKNQEFDTRGRIADNATSETDAQRLLLSLASGPQEQFYKVGGGYADKLHPEKGLVPLGDELSGGVAGGDAAAIQVLRAFGFIDPATGRVKPGMEQKAFDVMRTTGHVVDEGGVPGTLNFNPFGATAPGAPPATPRAAPPAVAPPSPAAAAPAPAVVPASGVGRVADNVRSIEEAKVLGRETAEAKMALPQAQARFRNQTQQMDLVMGNIDKVLPEISGWTTGPGGKLLGTIWGTPAYDLQSSINTIKANIGFQQLQQMRYESPTGGALGQVAVQELEFLQAALGNLETAQSPQNVRDALTQVRQRYDQFKAAAQADLNAAGMKAQGNVGSPGSAAPAVSLDEYLKSKGF